MKILSHDKAFEPIEGEVSIPIDYDAHDFQFTRRWFKYRNQATWSTFLKPKFGRSKPVKMIQIGVFEGMDLVWSLQNLLTHPESSVVAIDPWIETTKLDGEEMGEVEKRARHNLAPWKNKVTIMKGLSQDILPKLTKANWYDLIIIDGDHNAPAVVTDAEQALRLCKSGGWMLFDDVRNRIPKKDHVYDGLKTFVRSHLDEIELMWRHRFCDCFAKV